MFLGGDFTEIGFLTKKHIFAEDYDDLTTTAFFLNCPVIVFVTIFFNSVNSHFRATIIIPSCEHHLAPRLHLPPDGADLHQTGHHCCRFDSCLAPFLQHHVFLAMNILNARHISLSYTQVTGRRARGRTEHLPPG